MQLLILIKYFQNIHRHINAYAIELIDSKVNEQALVSTVKGEPYDGHDELRPRRLVHTADEVVAAVGSACHEEGTTVSGVLDTMGIEQDRARGAVRLSLGIQTTKEEIERAGEALISAWRACSKQPPESRFVR